jgi:hypothetical protein
MSVPKPRLLLEFKLHKLENTKLRYDVVYKNLLRDFRRFYCQDFSENNEFVLMKKKFTKQLLFQAIKEYIKVHGLMEFSQNTVNEEQLIFALGSLIYPKQMLKMFDSSYNRSKAKILRRDISDEWGMDGRRVI